MTLPVAEEAGLPTGHGWLLFDPAQVQMQSKRSAPFGVPWFWFARKFHVSFVSFIHRANMFGGRLPAIGPDVVAIVVADLSGW